MKLNRIFRLFEPIPTIILLAVALPFLAIGLLPLLGLLGWAIGREVRATRRIQAARQARWR